jgi:hypothetical protein
MRLGGTLAFPKDPKKIAAGYQIELTSPAFNAQARRSSIEELSGLSPYLDGPASEPRSSERQSVVMAACGEIIRDWTGRVTDGREAYWRNLVIARISAF